MSLRQRTRELAASNAALREPLARVLRTALSWVGGTFTTKPAKGYKPEEVKAVLYGPWAVHKALGGGGYAVSFAPAGVLLYSDFAKQDSAKRFVELLMEQAPALLNAKTDKDVLRGVKYETIKALAKQVQRPEQAEKRQKSLKRSRDPKVSALLNRFSGEIQKGDIDKIKKGMESLGYEAKFGSAEPALYEAIWEHPAVIEGNVGAHDLGHWFYTMYQLRKPQNADLFPDFVLTYGRIGNTLNYTFRKAAQ